MVLPAPGAPRRKRWCPPAAATSSANDAPVTGGVAGATAGTLLLFVSGAAEHVERARAVLEAVGTPEVVGDRVGDGQVMKVVNQLLCSVHLVAAAEALALAGRLGLDQARALDLLTRGGAASWMLGDRGPKMLSAPGEQVFSSVDIFVKDSGIVADAAEAAGLPVPVLRAAHEQFVAAHDAGLGSLDDSRVVDVYAVPEAVPAP
ncbi:NAD(P)-dependent oxidoreductase [Georgenia sp. SUBG003]|uniref:NAD(P)-dependent oxidoreductase n=1 Tax=Georgenia sp. SUBG003 TaxID=1497974 RepID=UPI003AB332B0